MTAYPPVFVINFPRHAQRRKFMEDQLRSLSLEYELVEAVDGRDLTETEVAALCQGQPEKYIGRPLGKGEIGCYLSHVKVMEMVCRRDIPEAVVLEDDVGISPDLPQFLEHRNKIPRHWGIVQLGVAIKEYRPVLWSKETASVCPGYDVARAFPLSYGTQGYFVRQEFCDRFIANAYPIIAPIDHRLFDIYLSIDFFYALKDKLLVFHDETFLALEKSVGPERKEKQKTTIRVEEMVAPPNFAKRFLKKFMRFLKLGKFTAWLIVYYRRTDLHKPPVCLDYVAQAGSVVARLAFFLKIFFAKSSS